MRNIKHLTTEQIEQLRRVVRQSEHVAYRKRCQCILYSFHGMSVSELMEVFDVDRRSIYNWLNRWEKGGLKALQDKPGRGVKPKLNPANAFHVEQVRRAFMDYPTQPQQALQHVNRHLAVPVSQDTLRRFYKKISH